MIVINTNTIFVAYFLIKAQVVRSKEKGGPGITGAMWRLCGDFEIKTSPCSGGNGGK